MVENNEIKQEIDKQTINVATVKEESDWILESEAIPDHEDSWCGEVVGGGAATRQHENLKIGAIRMKAQNTDII
jgi:hypothetical protein